MSSKNNCPVEEKKKYNRKLLLVIFMWVFGAVGLGHMLEFDAFWGASGWFIALLGIVGLLEVDYYNRIKK